MIGKFHLQSSGHRTEPRLDDGYRYWKFSHAPRDDWPEGHDYADWVREQGGDLNGLRKKHGYVPPEYHQTKWATDRAIEYIRQERTGPWMLTVNVYDPHPPFNPPPPYRDRFQAGDMPGPHFRDSDIATQERLKPVDFQTGSRHPDEFDGKEQQALYAAMIAQMDEQFGRLLRYLDDTGQRDNTLVVFTSDHGEMLGDHGLLFKGCRFYEGLVRVPLIFRWLGVVRAGVRSDALVELLDLSDTLLDFAGIAPPEEMQGHSLRPILDGSASPDHHRDFVRCEYFDALDAAFIGTGSPDVPKTPASGGCQPPGDRDGEVATRNRPVHTARSPGSYGTMYRDRRYKLVVYHGLNLGELYDLETDPWEFDNLWESPEHQTVKSELVLRSFDATMLTGVDVGTRRIAPM